MATKFFLRDSTSPFAPDALLEKDLLLTAGPTKTTAVTNTATADVIPITKTAAGTGINWFTNKLNAGTPGNITFNLWGLESNMSANVVWVVHVHEVNGISGAIVQSLWTGTTNVDSVEVATAAGVRNWTATGTGSIAQGNRIRVRVGLNFATLGMVSGFTATLDYDGPTAAADGDSWVSFVGTLTEYHVSLAANPRRSRERNMLISRCQAFFKDRSGIYLPNKSIYTPEVVVA